MTWAFMNLLAGGGRHSIPRPPSYCPTNSPKVILRCVQHAFHFPDLCFLVFPIIRFMLNRLRGTCVGANNRLDLLSLVTSGVGTDELDGRDDMLGVVEQWQDDETHNPDVPAVSHRRGLAPFVFVPFEEVNSSFASPPLVISTIV